MESARLLTGKNVALVFSLFVAVALVSGCTNTGQVTGNTVADVQQEQEPQQQVIPQDAVETVALGSLLASKSSYIGREIEVTGIVGPYDYSPQEKTGIKYAFMEGEKSMPIMLFDLSGNLEVSKMSKMYRIKGVVKTIDLCRCEAKFTDVSGQCTVWYPYLNTDWKQTNGFWEPVSGCQSAGAQIACKRINADKFVETGLYTKELRCSDRTEKTVIYLGSTVPEVML